MKTVGIIGASGFIGSFITKKFLQEGYKVRVSAYEMARMDKYNHFESLPEFAHLEIVPLIAENKRALKDFISGCSVLVHAGTPFQVDARNASMTMPEIVEIDTIKYLDVISKNANLDRVILIESIEPFNTNFSMPWDDEGFKINFNECHSKFINVENNFYPGLQFQPNKAIQGFMDSHPNIGFKIFSIAPFLDNSQAHNKRDKGESLHFLIKQHQELSYTR